MTDPIPAGAPAGGSSLSSDDDPTGNDGTLGADTASGDAGSTLGGAADGEDPLTDDDALGSDDEESSTRGTYSNDPEADDAIKEQLDK
jgi:hypothetical protein